jgi:hypothetical protein
MGGDLDLYIVNTNVQHDPELTCLMWDKSECREIMEEELYKHAFPTADWKDVNKKRKSYWHDNVKETTICKWCPKCALFAYDFYESPHLVAKYNIHHSYSNDIWMSKYFIKNMWIGSSDTEFKYEDEYRRGYTVYEWTLEHVKNRLENLNSPQDENEADICAYEEIGDMLQFAKNDADICAYEETGDMLQFAKNDADIRAYEETVDILQFAKNELQKEADPNKRPRAFFCPEF